LKFLGHNLYVPHNVSTVDYNLESYDHWANKQMEAGLQI
jgi:hypothetical protein